MNNEERLDDFLDKGTEIRKTAASLLKDGFRRANNTLAAKNTISEVFRVEPAHLTTHVSKDFLEIWRD